VTVSFKAMADLSKYGNYKIVTYGLDNNDDYLFNDTLTTNIDNTKISETLSVFPNPFSDKLTITLNSQIDDRIHISISNMSGVKLYDIEKDILIGNNSITLSDLRLIPAIYYLNVHGTTINNTISVIKLNK
jgi:glycosidase